MGTDDVWDNIEVTSSDAPAETVDTSSGEAVTSTLESTETQEGTLTTETNNTTAADNAARAREDVPEVTAVEASSETEQKEPETEKPDETDDEIFLEPKTQEEKDALIKAMPRGAARRWAAKNAERAEAMKKYVAPDVSIGDFKSELETLSPSRYGELRNHLIFEAWDNPLHREELIKDKFGDDATFNEVQKAWDSYKNGAPATQTQLSQEDEELLLEELAGIEDETLAADIRARFLAKNEQIKKLEGDVKNTNERLDKLEGREAEELKAKQAEEVKAQVDYFNQEAGNYYDSVWKRVEKQGIRELGLEITDEDTPEIKVQKTALQKMMQQFAEPIFDSIEDNQKNMSRVVKILETAAQTKDESARKAELKNANEYVDVLAAGGLLAIQKLQEDESNPFAVVFGMFKELQNLRRAQLTSHRRSEVVGNGSTNGGLPRHEPKSGQGTDALWDEVSEEVDRDMKLRANG